jgi:drug/metabolite transporter (DMT)-like permease
MGAPASCREVSHVSSAAALVALHVAVALFGLAGLFGKLLDLSPLAIVLGRTLVAAIALGAAALVRREPLGRLDAAMLLNGAILALHWVTFFLAIQVSSVAIGLLGFAGFPLFTLVLERHGRLRGVSSAEWATVALVAAGFALLVPHPSLADRNVQGLALGALSGLTFAWLAVRNRALLAGRSAIGLAFWQNAWAATWLVVAIVPIASTLQAPSLEELGALVTLGALCTALAHTLFIASMRKLSAHTASVVAGLEPLYGIAFAAWLLDEIPGMRELAAAALLLSAAMLATRRAVILP